MNAKKVGQRQSAAANADADRHELEESRNDWWIFLLIGFLLLVCGVFAIAFPFMASVGFAIVFGATLMVAGVGNIIAAFWAGKWGGFFLQILMGIFYLVIGFAIIDAPADSIAVLTLLIAAFFVVIGIFRIVASLSIRFPQWGLSLVGGILTTLVGLVIYKTYPVSALWVIGILIAVELISAGIYWMGLGVALKNLDED